MSQPKAGEVWGIVEVMGHSKYAGRLSEYTGLGPALLRVEVPAVGERPTFEKLLGNTAIFAITPCTKEAAVRAAECFAVRPLGMVGLPSSRIPRRELPDFLDYADEDESGGEP